LVDVTWIMQEASTGGSIAENGTYTAPTTLGTYHLNPTSVFDPTQSDTANISIVASRFFSTTGRMARPRSSHTATELLSGKVLAAGGFTEFGEFSAISATELYDPDSASFSTTGSMTTERALNCIIRTRIDSYCGWPTRRTRSWNCGSSRSQSNSPFR